MNENMLLAMFEEIKISLSEINTQIKSPKVENENDVEEKVCQIGGYLSYLEQTFESTLHNTIVSHRRVLEGEMVREREQLEEFIFSDSAKLRHLHKHEHIIDIKSSKVIFTMMTLGISLFIAIVGFVHSYDKVSALEDNDWKYRYVKSMKGIDKQKLSELENVFEYNRNEETISKIKDHIIKYEQALEKKAQNLEQFELLE